MNVSTGARRRALGIVVLSSTLFAGCAGRGGAAGEPMVADPPSNDVETAAESAVVTPSDESDAGANGASGSDDNDEAAVSQPAPGTAEAPTTAAAISQGDDEGARALLAQFVATGADHAALTRSLRPTTNDYKTLFDAKLAAKVEAAQAKDWSSNKAIVKPKPGQTEVKVWSATGADLSKGTGNAKEFPEGYEKVAKHLAPSILFFRFKFVAPGKEVGTAYDGLAFVNGHWVIAPKPWRALERKADDVDATKKPVKPAPKKKPTSKKR